MIAGLDSSENFNFIAFVVGDIKLLRNFYFSLLRAINEHRLHVSKLKRQKRQKLLRFVAINGIPFKAFCIETKFLSIVRQLSKTHFIPKQKARELILERILRKIRHKLERNHITLTTVYIDHEFEPYKKIISRVFRANIVPKSFATELADLIAYLNRIKKDEGIINIKFP